MKPKDHDITLAYLLASFVLDLATPSWRPSRHSACFIPAILARFGNARAVAA
jgi:hypothetical protein